MSKLLNGALSSILKHINYISFIVGFWWPQSLEKVMLFSHWGSTAGGPRGQGRGGRGRWLLEGLWDSLLCMYGSSGWFAWSGIRETSLNSASSAEQTDTAECETIGLRMFRNTPTLNDIITSLRPMSAFSKQFTGNLYLLPSSCFGCSSGTHRQGRWWRVWKGNLLLQTGSPASTRNQSQIVISFQSHLIKDQIQTNKKHYNYHHLSFQQLQKDAKTQFLFLHKLKHKQTVSRSESRQKNLKEFTVMIVCLYTDPLITQLLTN